MKKLLIVFAVLLFPVSAFAEWTYITDNGKAFFYADFSTLERKGNFVKIWRSRTLTKPERHRSGYTYDRLTIYSEYDCVQKKERELSYTAFFYLSEVFRRDGPSRWVYVPLDTLNYTVMKRVCAK